MTIDSPLFVSRLLTNFDQPWFIAGGWALDLFLGEETRPHKDIEVAVLRGNQLQLRRYLWGWTFKVIVPATGGHSEPWHDEQWLDSPMHEIHGTSSDGAALEILLNEHAGSEWVFRRDHRVRAPLSHMGSVTPGGIPYLAPEIVLLYKAAARRAVDEVDFRSTLPALGSRQRAWLLSALEVAYPDSPWTAAVGG
jgi:hypothetical protein